MSKPKTSKTALAAASQETVAVQTLGGRMHVRWDETTQATPHGQLVFFAEFLTMAGVFERWVEECPLSYTSPNASSKRDRLPQGLVVSERRPLLQPGYPLTTDAPGAVSAQRGFASRHLPSPRSHRRNGRQPGWLYRFQPTDLPCPSPRPPSAITATASRRSPRLRGACAGSCGCTASRTQRRCCRAFPVRRAHQLSLRPRPARGRPRPRRAGQACRARGLRRCIPVPRSPMRLRRRWRRAPRCRNAPPPRRLRRTMPPGCFPACRATR